MVMHRSTAGIGEKVFRERIALPLSREWKGLTGDLHTQWSGWSGN